MTRFLRRTNQKRLSPVLLARDAPVPEKAERRLRVVLVSQYFPPEIGATQMRMQAFAEFLAARGHEATVICEFPNHPHGAIPAEYHGCMPAGIVKSVVEKGLSMRGSGPTRRRFYKLGADLYGAEYLQRASTDTANSVRRWAVRQLQK